MMAQGDVGGRSTFGTRHFWILVVGLSLALRLLALHLLDGRAPDGDTPNYLAIATNLLSGRGMVVDDPNNLPGMRATYPPLYPLLLAGAGLLLPLGMATITALNTLIDGACAALIARLGKDIGHRPAGLLAAALYFAWPTNVGMAPLARKEGLIALLVVALLVSLHRLARGPDRRAAMTYGLLAALLALCQPGLVTLPALFAIAAIPFVSSIPKFIRSMAVAAGVAILALLPWWVRNWVQFDRFVPLTAASGYSLWIGATPAGDGTWIQPPPRFRTGDEFSMSAAMGREARALIAAHPLDYLGHCLAKLARAFLSEERGVGQIHWAEPRAHLRIAQYWIAIAGAAHVAALIAAAARAIVTRGDFLARMFAAGLLQVLLFGMWFEFDQRHRYFLTPLILLLAAGAVLDGLRTPAQVTAARRAKRGSR